MEVMGWMFAVSFSRGRKRDVRVEDVKGKDLGCHLSFTFTDAPFILLAYHFLGVNNTLSDTWVSIRPQK
jgi:hypothetical protein